MNQLTEAYEVVIADLAQSIGWGQFDKDKALRVLKQRQYELLTVFTETYSYTETFTCPKCGTDGTVTEDTNGITVEPCACVKESK